MTEIIEIKDSDEEKDLTLGSESAGKRISYQLAQDFYNEITGKSERLSDYIESSFILSIDDLEQLHLKMSQSTEQYNVCGGNEVYSVKYISGQSKRFTSFDRLKLHIGDCNSAIEEIDITFKLLIVLPKTKRPQEYTINIELISKVAKVTNMREEIENLPIPPHLISFSGKRTGKISIDFIDISVANYIMSTISNWVNSLESVEENKIIKSLSKKSKHFPFIFKFILLALLAYYIYSFSTTIEIDSLNMQYQFLIGTLASGFLFYQIGDYLGVKSRYHLNQIYDFSYIRMTKADDRLIKKSKKSLTKSLWLGSISVATALVIGIASSLIAHYIPK